MASYKVEIKVLCKCKKWQNINFTEGTYGGQASIPCWNCNLTLVYKSGRAYYQNGSGELHETKYKTISRTQIGG